MVEVREGRNSKAYRTIRPLGSKRLRAQMRKILQGTSLGARKENAKRVKKEKGEGEGLWGRGRSARYPPLKEGGWTREGRKREGSHDCPGRMEESRTKHGGGEKEMARDKEGNL